MLRLPSISGLIKRRLLINFRADPVVVQQMLPTGFSPRLFKDEAIVGICLIRLEQIRPKGLPALLGVSSENAAHRVAVQWTDADGTTREGVYISRRDTDSKLVALGGGRIFPGEYFHSHFKVLDQGDVVSLSMSSADGEAAIRVVGRMADFLPDTSCFGSLEEASTFFENGCIGYSATSDPSRLDGIELKAHRWEVLPFEVTDFYSSFFDSGSLFPAGTLVFDHGLIMRNIRHDWVEMPDFRSKS